MRNIHSIALTVAALFFAAILSAQNEKPAVDTDVHRIVFHLTSNDTLVHKATIKQINNILTAAPNSKIEVVCHSHGLSFLVAAQTKQAAKIKEYKAKGVEFMACENTMRDQKVKREDLLPESGTVPSGVMEVVKKQEQGWSYLRAGL